MSYCGIINKIEINSTGLECCVEIDFGDLIGRLNCYMLLSEIYDPYSIINQVLTYVEDSEPKIMKVGDKRHLKLWGVFGNKLQKVNKAAEENIFQSRTNSPHTEFVATVNEIVDQNIILCSIGVLGNDILVDFEEQVNYLLKGDRVKFDGEVKVELID